MIVSVLFCQDHGRIGTLKFLPPVVDPRSGEWLFTGPWLAVFDRGGEIGGYGLPDIPCVAEPECTALIDLFHMPP